MELDLYSLPTNGVKMQRCGGNLGSENQQCVEFGEIPGSKGAFVLGDSKNPGAGQLRFTEDELTAFSQNFLAGRGTTA